MRATRRSSARRRRRCTGGGGSPRARRRPWLPGRRPAGAGGAGYDASSGGCGPDCGRTGLPAVALPEPCVGALDPLAQADAVAPAESVEAADVEELAGRAVGLAGVERQPQPRSHHRAEGRGQLADAQVLAGADVDVLVLVVVPHQEPAGVADVAEVQALAPGRARAPDRHLLPPRRPGAVE